MHKKIRLLPRIFGAICSARGGPPGGPLPGGPPGDPIDHATGQFTFTKTDLIIPGTPPIVISRTYRSPSPNSTLGTFGFNQRFGYDYILLRTQTHLIYNLDLQEPDGFAIPYNFVEEDQYQNTSRPDYQGSKIFWNGEITEPATLRFKDGRIWTFTSFSPGKWALTEQRDRNGNGVRINRDAQGNAIRITNSSGQSVQMTLITPHARIATITDSIGRKMLYEYDTSERLTAVIDPAGGKTRYTYDSQGRMAAITDARGIEYLRNEYVATFEGGAIVFGSPNPCRWRGLASSV